MNLTNLQNKQIGILGWGVENRALVDFLIKKKVKCEITICDARENISVGTHNYAFLHYQLGKKFNQELYKFDILFRSPGWPIFCPGVQEAIKFKPKVDLVYSPMKLFFDLCLTKNIIGVTGTKGKGTTSTLIYQILKTAGERVYLGGNIGVAPFSFLTKIKKSDYVVLEMSSFQLEDMKQSPHLAVVTNFSREHLAPADPFNPNYHQTMKSYWEAKANIFKWQEKGDYVIVNPRVISKIKKTKSKVVTFGKSELPSRLPGEHNKENIAAAVEVAKILKIKPAAIARAVKNFKGLEHRIELVRELNGVKYFDDSFATTPESAITALKSFSAPIILLAGGAEKNSDFREFAREVKKRVKYVVLFNGKTTPRLKKELLKINFFANKIKVVKSMKEAVVLSQRKATSGDIVLMSPACASFGMFKNYKERGDLFKQEVGH